MPRNSRRNSSRKASGERSKATSQRDENGRFRSSRSKKKR